MSSLADRELREYDYDLTVQFQGRTYPVYYLMEKLLKIVDKNGKCIPFKLNFQQIKLYKDICRQRREKKPVRENVLKARQIGFSTFIAGLFFIIGMFTPNIKVGIVADKEDHAKNIFSKYQFFYDHLDDENPNYEECRRYEAEHKGKPSPLSYKPVLKAQRGQQLFHTRYGNSILEVVVAGESSGRSTTYNLLHLSECAFFQNLKVTLNGLLETVSSKNKESMIFLETTANGFNEYKDRWDKDASGMTSYTAFFVPWFLNPEYSDDEFEEYYRRTGKEKELPKMEEWLYERQETYKLTNAQIKFYWDKYQDKGDKGMTLQEYPFSPVDAFLTSGNCVFGAELVARRKEEVLKNILNVKTGKFVYEKNFSHDGSVIELSQTEFREIRNGEIRIFEEPDPTHPYVGICDPNNGGRDDTAIQIIDNYTLKQVAVFQSKEMSLDRVAYQFYLLGKMYNWALLSNEMNLGKTVMEYLIKLQYPKLYIRQKLEYEDYSQRISKTYGHVTSKANRQGMIEAFQIAFNENPRIINDYQTLCQMETFQKVKHVDKQGKETFKDEASGSNHDDLVTAFMAFFIVRTQQSAIPSQDPTKQSLRKFTSIEEAQAYYEEKMRRASIKNSALERFTGIRF